MIIAHAQCTRLLPQTQHAVRPPRRFPHAGGVAHGPLLQGAADPGHGAPKRPGGAQTRLAACPRNAHACFAHAAAGVPHGLAERTDREGAEGAGGAGKGSGHEVGGGGAEGAAGSAAALPAA